MNGETEAQGGEIMCLKVIFQCGGGSRAWTSSPSAEPVHVIPSVPAPTPRVPHYFQGPSQMSLYLCNFPQ